jgi:phospholipid transport system substrate-binding protein
MSTDAAWIARRRSQLIIAVNNCTQDKGPNMLAAYPQIGLMSKRLILKVLTLAVCFCLWDSPALPAENPQTVVQTVTGQIIKILEQYPQDIRARRQQIEAVINKHVDFEAITRLAIGRRWNNLPPDKQMEFTREFSKLLFNTYIGDLEKYVGENITYTNRPVDQGYVVVKALIKDQNGPISLEYFLHLRDGEWKVYDVGVAGRSLVMNYRNQFDSILANGSFNDLSMMLRRRIAKLCGSNSC